MKMEIIVRGKIREGKATIIEIIINALLKHGFEFNLSEFEINENKPGRSHYTQERIETIKKKVGVIQISSEQIRRLR